MTKKQLLKEGSSIKYVYFFGNGSSQGNISMKNILGNKGANLCEMTNFKIPVPPGFVISTEACIAYYDSHNSDLPPGLMDEVNSNLQKLEDITQKRLGSSNPLLLSIRSGAPASMPGMMDTVLNLGLNDDTARALADISGDERFACDCYRRFLDMFGNVVLGINHNNFEHILKSIKKEAQVTYDNELSIMHMKKLIVLYKDLIFQETGQKFPSDPTVQLKMAIEAVFRSWNNKRATSYRNLNNIPHNLGTAVNVQAMVFGNTGNKGATGVCFTRNPANGEKHLYGEFLLNAQGEDIVAGIRTPQNVDILKKVMPQIYEELRDTCKKIEDHYHDMQDIEFTVEKSKLYILQTRTGKRTAMSAVKIAVDMVREGLIDKQVAVLRVDPAQINQLLFPDIDPKAPVRIIARGMGASPGAAVGKVVFNQAMAVLARERGEKVILVRPETSPEDIAGMNASQGILTATGGMTSHAAVVARGMGKCCIVGCSGISIFEDAGVFIADDVEVHEGDIITLNGTTGEVILGEAKLIRQGISGDFRQIMDWSDDFRKLGVEANADTPHDAKIALDFGAEGIGLCRTEHMFFGKDRLPYVRQMILATSTDERNAALSKLLDFQKSDFYGIFEVMEEKPVTIRLLDPPLHEFLPATDADIEKVSKEMRVSFERLKDIVTRLHEVNPMLGHRGCRLGITYPEIYEMQVRAIIEAGCDITRNNRKVNIEIMVPLVAHLNEFVSIKKRIMEIAEKIMHEKKVTLAYRIGTMIEVPRAAVTADEIAREAEFFSFGTNDLTQMGFGLSRDDAGKFLPFYVKNDILDSDPFISIDQKGIGELIRIGVEKGRSTRKDLTIGICGEHGGDPKSIEFCHKIGLNYVSCSPYRVPVARLAAAHAALKERINLMKNPTAAEPQSINLR
ncbi:MAG: pyruvate, phosphate dikinase [archaeon]